MSFSGDARLGISYKLGAGKIIILMEYFLFDTNIVNHKFVKFNPLSNFPIIWYLYNVIHGYNFNEKLEAVTEPGESLAGPRLFTSLLKYIILVQWSRCLYRRRQ